MIFDTLKNAELYYGCHDGFKKGFDFIKKVIADGTEVGKYEIDGKNVWASVQAYDPKEPHEKFEAHKNYIDIQFIVSGKEYMECAYIDNCELMTEYNPEKDVAFYTASGDKVRLDCEANTFAIYFPEDVHKPGIKLVDGVSVKKVVVKVHI